MSNQLQAKFSVVWSEAQWRLWLILTSGKKIKSEGDPERAALAKQRVSLRNLLRKNPRWIRGHLLLAECEWKLFQMTHESVVGRSANPACVSAKAALALISTREPSDKMREFQLEAERLLHEANA